jgi:hypothetical protein
MAYMLFSWFGLFKEHRSTGEGEGFHTAFEGKKKKGANQNSRRGKLK